MYIYIYLFIYGFVCACISVDIRICIYIYMHRYIRILKLHSYIHTYIYMYTPTYIYVHMCIYLHPSKYIHIQVSIRISVYMNSVLACSCWKWVQINESTYVMTTRVFVYFHPPCLKSVLNLPTATCMRESVCVFICGGVCMCAIIYMYLSLFINL